MKLRDLGEQALIETLTRGLAMGTSVVVGPGDDAAVVAIDGCPNYLVLTTDPVVLDVHFTRETPPEQIGHKALARNLSDIAAMGGRPLWCLVSLVADADTEAAFIEAVYAGMSRLAAEFGVSIVGGDVAHRPGALSLTVTLAGDVEPALLVRRTGASPGDLLYVTGELGGSIRGRHLRFTPRVREARFLAGRRWPTAMIDLSDGLATDLRHICAASRCGAEIRETDVPVSDDAVRLAADGNTDPIAHALCDGEDFELLFAVAEPAARELEAAWTEAFPDLALSRIGRMTPPPSDRITFVRRSGDRVPLDLVGYDHFASGTDD